MKKWLSNNFLDRCGMTVSGLCGIHCAALVLISVLQPISTWLGQMHETLHAFEMGMVISATVFAALALVSGFRHHGHGKPVLLGCAGLFLLWSVAGTELHEYWWAPFLTASGGIALIISHRWNIKCRCAHQSAPVLSP